MKKKRSFFGKQFKKIMLEKDINQRELADRLGITKAMITNWISGVRNPSLDSIKKISSVLDIDYNYFIENSDLFFTAPFIISSVPFISHEKPE